MEQLEERSWVNMPKKKLKKEKLRKYKKLLLKRGEELIEQIQQLGNESLNKSLKEVSGDLSSYMIHMADVATDSYNRDFSLDLVTNEQKKLYRISKALKRIEEGTYGFCQECGKKISDKRLNAVPYAELCLEHQRKKEKKKKE
jgi:RNA polymerase-binding protein DksA